MSLLYALLFYLSLYDFITSNHMCTRFRSQSWLHYRRMYRPNNLMPLNDTVILKPLYQVEIHLVVKARDYTSNHYSSHNLLVKSYFTCRKDLILTESSCWVEFSTTEQTLSASEHNFLIVQEIQLRTLTVHKTDLVPDCKVESIVA